MEVRWKYITKEEFINTKLIYPTSLMPLYTWHQEVGSDQFCIIINSPWLYTFTLYIFLYPLIFYYWKSIYYSTFIISTIFTFISTIISFYFWDLLRELYKKYELYYIVLFLVFFLILTSETLLFISFFWRSLHSLLSTFLPLQFLYLTSPIHLSFTNTILLSNAGISLSTTFISLEITSSYFLYYSILSFINAILFIFLQIKEFRILTISINDSIYTSIFFFLTGLHFFHLIIGLFLLLLSLLYLGCNYWLIISQRDDCQ